MEDSDFFQPPVFVKKLSNNGVSLGYDGKKYIVIREGTLQKISNILDFYKNVEFSLKPKILHINCDRTKIYEEYLLGDLLLSPSTQDIMNLSKNIGLLSNVHGEKQTIDDYIKTQFEQKLLSIQLSCEDTDMIKNFFHIFRSLCPNKEIQTNRVHGDLKGDNILRKNQELFFIDFEWSKIGHFVEDIQKFIAHTLQYDKVKTDNFINYCYKNTSLEWSIFVFLESFHFFLYQVLQLSKKRITQDDCNRLIENKINTMVNSSIHSIQINQRSISIGTTQIPSKIFHSQKQSGVPSKPEHIMFHPHMNNQEQRLEINKGLMLKYRDFIVLHGACIKLIDGRILLIGGLSGSGKTHTYNLLVQSGVVEKLYDEDLVCMNSQGEIFGLGKDLFKGTYNGEYVYQEDENFFGKIDNVLFITDTKNGLHQSIMNQANIIQYLLHERYQNNPDLEIFYRNFEIPPHIQAHILGNNKRDSDITLLIDFLGKK